MADEIHNLAVNLGISSAQAVVQLLRALIEFPSLLDTRWSYGRASGHLDWRLLRSKLFTHGGSPVLAKWAYGASGRAFSFVVALPPNALLRRPRLRKG